MCIAVAPFPLAEKTGGEKIPPAFPEGREHLPKTDAADSPKAGIPGAAADSSIEVAPVSVPTSADWLLRRMAGSEDPEIRRRAAEAWPVSDAFMEDMNALVRALSDPSDEVRAGAVERLNRLEPALVFGYVMRTMLGGAPDHARALDAALPALEGTLAPFMIETLRTEIETPQHRRIAAYCLGRMGSLNAIETLGEHAWADDMTVARACVEALYAIGASHTTPQWMSLLDHGEPYFRRLAARALAALGGPNAFDRLRLIVLDNNEDAALQSDILYALSADPSPPLYALLVEALERNQQARPVALRLLRELAGVDFGWDMTAWRSWLDSISAERPPPIVPAQ